MPSLMGPMQPEVVEHQQVDCPTRYRLPRLILLPKEILGPIAIALKPKIPKEQFCIQDFQEAGLLELLPYAPAAISVAWSNEALCEPWGYQG